jgi:hypothetical protein
LPQLSVAPGAVAHKTQQFTIAVFASSVVAQGRRSCAGLRYLQRYPNALYGISGLPDLTASAGAEALLEMVFSQPIAGFEIQRRPIGGRRFDDFCRPGHFVTFLCLLQHPMKNSIADSIKLWEHTNRICTSFYLNLFGWCLAGGFRLARRVPLGYKQALLMHLKVRDKVCDTAGC